MKRTVITVTCDIGTGEHEADETVRFALGDNVREIDVCGKHRAVLDKAMAPFMDSGRKIAASPAGTSPARRGAGRTNAERERSRDIRAWAERQGLPVTARGRIAAGIVDKYDAR
jgi:hypothetical protein